MADETNEAIGLVLRMILKRAGANPEFVDGQWFRQTLRIVVPELGMVAAVATNSDTGDAVADWCENAVEMNTALGIKSLTTRIEPYLGLFAEIVSGKRPDVVRRIRQLEGRSPTEFMDGLGELAGSLDSGDGAAS